MNANKYVDDGENKFWFQNGKSHRTDGPAIELKDGTKLWYKTGKLHRENGPAVEYPNGTKLWYFNNRLHREDGPAVVDANGNKEWWCHGNKFSTEEDFKEWEKNCKVNAAKTRMMNHRFNPIFND